MARLPKPQLFAAVERAIIEGGWRYLRLPSAGEHPARYSIYRDEQRIVVRVYIWNLTLGGKNRPLDEWRKRYPPILRFWQPSAEVPAAIAAVRPSNRRDHPARRFIDKANELRGWSF